jgi:hypothetical protein
MDRERKLLYVVAILAPILELLMLLMWHQANIPARVQLVGELHSCQERLARTVENFPAPRVNGRPI